MQTLQNNLFSKFFILFLALSFWKGDVSAFDWSVHPVFGIDTNGNVTAVWEGTDPDTFNSIIQSNYLPFGGSWQGVETLTPNDEVSYSPRLAVNANGDAVAIWQNTDTSNNTTLQGSIAPASGSWGTNEVISTDDMLLSEYEVTISNGGNIAAVWTAYIDTSYISVIRSATSTVSTGTWSLPQTISP